MLKKIPKLIKVDKRLEEQNLGDWTGLKYDYLTQITKEKKCFSNNWLMRANYQPPNGESFNNVKHRIQEFINEIIKEHYNKNIILFSHGGPIRAAISIALNIQSNDLFNVNIDNTKLTIIEYNENNWFLRALNV